MLHNYNTSIDFLQQLWALLYQSDWPHLEVLAQESLGGQHYSQLR